MTRILAVLITAWQLADAVTPSGVLLAAAVLAVGLAVLTVRRTRLVAVTPVAEGSAALRSRAGRTVVLRLLDPDAAGRPRPRAPSF